MWSIDDGCKIKIKSAKRSINRIQPSVNYFNDNIKGAAKVHKIYFFLFSPLIFKNNKTQCMATLPPSRLEEKARCWARKTGNHTTAEEKKLHRIKACCNTLIVYIERIKWIKKPFKIYWKLSQDEPQPTNKVFADTQPETYVQKC